MNRESDIIAAIATAPGVSGIGIVRVSGKNSIETVEKLFKTKSGAPIRLSEAPTHTVHYGYIYDGEEAIDEVLVTVFRSPRSYTTEDTAEINCHGGILLLKRILAAVIKNGARPAEPGEFTKRAFMNGRIDLTEAESVMDLISSKNEFARKNALMTLRGEVYREVNEMREEILHNTAFIEAALDDPEHYSLDEFSPVLLEKTEEICDRIETIIKTSNTGRILKEGIRTSIVGRPNVGKSSLLNALTGDETAIVTDIPGTTRDLLRSEIVLNGLLLNMTDTAGIRSTEDKVEKIGVERSKDEILKSDLILFIIDSSEDIRPEDLEIFDYIKEKKAIILLNKSDLVSKISTEDVRQYSDAPVISISAKNMEGIGDLKREVERLFFSGEILVNNEVYITNERQLSCFRRALNSLGLVKESVELKISEEFFTVDLMDAYSALGEIIGEDTKDDLADKIFSDFCMGK